MKIRINDRDIDIFEGASLQDALRMYSPSELESVESSYKKIIDQDGNQVALDGELLEGDIFFIKDC
jgi:hypothetical protein